jgi:hypothetical protein
VKPLLLSSPWAQQPIDSGEVCVAERPSLLLPGDVQSIRVVGTNLDLPAIGRWSLDGQTYSRFELLGTGIQDPGVDDIEFEVDGGIRHFRLGLRGGLVWTEEESRDDPCPGGRTQNLLGRHVELLGEVDSAPQRRGGCATVDLSEFLDRWGTSEEGTDARIALIVRIAEGVGSLIDDLCQSPRQILRRKRTLERVANVRQIDPAGIRWLVRQPGRTLVQRAGPRQRVLAVVREESFDTLENRVLRDMLERSRTECRSWLQDNIPFQASARFQSVQRYGSVVRRHSLLSPIARVPRVAAHVKANYVLQHDPRYSRIWPWYQRLRRKQEEKDSLWRWSHRTFAEAVRLSLAWALDILQEEAEVPTGAGWRRDLLIRSEQEHGALVDPRTRLANWILTARGEPLGASLLSQQEVRDLERASGARSRLHELAPDALVCSHSLFKRMEVRRSVLVWCRLRFGSSTLTEKELGEMAKRVSECSGRVLPTVLLVEPGDLGARAKLIDPRTVPTPRGDSLSILHATVPLHLDRTRDFFARELRKFLLDDGRA